MTDQDEFAARSQLQMDAGRQRMDIALSPPANGPRGPRQGPLRHVAISQSRRHPKRHGQPELVQGCCTGSSREGGRLRACKHPLKTPAKQGVFSTKIVAHSFKRGLGIRMADYAHSGGHSHRHCPLTTPRLVAATFAASLQVFCLAGSDSEKFWASAKALRNPSRLASRDM